MMLYSFAATFFSGTNFLVFVQILGYMSTCDLFIFHDFFYYVGGEAFCSSGLLFTPSFSFGFH